MKKITFTRLAEISSVVSLLFLLFPQLGSIWKEGIQNLDWYKTGLLIVFIVSAFIVLREKIKEYSQLKEWLTYHSPNYEKQSFSNMEGKINYLIDVKLQYAKDRKQNNVEEERARIISRLDSLSDDEQAWIAYCLSKDRQTLITFISHPTANSLLNKGVLIQGTGHALGLPFHIRDDVWKYLREHKNEYLSKFISNESKRKEIKNYEETLRAGP